MFDPYRKWLGIPAGQRPPNHYQLLGISADERDLDVINAAVLRQSAFVRNFQVGQYSAEATRVLNEIAAAKVCLLDPAKRAQYDAEQAGRAPANPTPSDSATIASSPAAASPRVPQAQPPSEPPRPGPRPNTARPAAARPQLAPARALPADLGYSLPAGARSPRMPRTVLGSGGYRSRGSDKRALWIGLALFGCSLPLTLTFMFLISRSDQQPAAVARAETPADSPSAPPPVADNSIWTPPATTGQSLPPVAPALQSAPAPAVFEQPSEPSPAPEYMPPSPSTTSPSTPASEYPEADSPSPAPSPAETPGAAGAPQLPNDLSGFMGGMEGELDRRRRATGQPTPFGSGSGNSYADNSAGQDTMFVGHDGGSSRRTVKSGSLMRGVTCRLSQWGREQCIGEIRPLFSRDESPELPLWEVAREGYAVGSARVSTYNYVNAIQLVYMRVKADGQLDPADTYTGEWLGVRGRGKTLTISGDGSPIIGIHARQGAVLDALALVVDRKASSSSPPRLPDRSRRPRSSRFGN